MGVRLRIRGSLHILYPESSLARFPLPPRPQNSASESEQGEVGSLFGRFLGVLKVRKWNWLFPFNPPLRGDFDGKMMMPVLRILRVPPKIFFIHLLEGEPALMSLVK